MSRWLSDRSGTTAVEYGLIIGLLFLAIVTAMTSFGNTAATKINSVSDAIVSAVH